LIRGKILLIPLLRRDIGSGISMEQPFSLLTFKPLLFFFSCLVVRRGCRSRRNWGGCWRGCGRRRLRVSGGQALLLFLCRFMLYYWGGCRNYWRWLSWDSCGRGRLRVRGSKALLLFLSRFMFYNWGSYCNYGCRLSVAGRQTLACGMGVCERARGF
jgi:hypothetical protein